MDAFDRRFGGTQGRIEPTNATPTDGDYMFCIGSDTDGETWELELDDKIEVSQSVDVTSIKLIRFNARIRAPATMPASTVWALSWLADGTVQRTIYLYGGEDTIDLTDQAFDVSQMSGSKTILFRLQFEAAP